MKNESRDNEAPGERALQHACCDAAQSSGQVLQRQRHTRGPLSAHADAEQCPAHKQHGIRGRETAQHREDGKPQNGQNQGELASHAVGHRSCRRSANQAEHERDGSKRARQRVVDGEASLDVDEDERENGVVEAVQHPAEERRQKRPPLVGRQRFRVFDQPWWHADVSVLETYMHGGGRWSATRKTEHFVADSNLKNGERLAKTEAE